MRIRADTNNPKKVPAVGDLFIVRRVEKGPIWWRIELEKVEDSTGGRQ